MFSQKNTSDKAIPKMSSSSLGLLHSLGPYYTAIWKYISQLVPLISPWAPLNYFRELWGEFVFFFKSLLCFHQVHMMKSFLLMVWLMGALLKILVLVINWCTHLMPCCLINLMKSLCICRAYSLWPTSSMKMLMSLLPLTAMFRVLTVFLKGVQFESESLLHLTGFVGKEKSQADAPDWKNNIKTVIKKQVEA